MFDLQFCGQHPNLWMVVSHIFGWSPYFFRPFTAYQEKAGQVEVFVYRHEMDAKIDLSKRREDRSGVFNWDDAWHD